MKIEIDFDARYPDYEVKKINNNEQYKIENLSIYHAKELTDWQFKVIQKIQKDYEILQKWLAMQCNDSTTEIISDFPFDNHDSIIM